MNMIEKLIKEIQKQLFPYNHESDISRDQSRWDVDPSEYLESWFLEHLRLCCHRSGCDKSEKCVYFSYSDQARRNYEICRQVRLLMEGGKIKCDFENDNNDKAQD